MDREQAQRALEVEVLCWIARLPLVRRAGLDWLTGAPAEAVDQALDLLRRTGWTEAVGVPFDAPAAEHGLVLRPAAVRPFAATFGVDEAALRRTWPVGATALDDCLGRYETTQAVTHALVSIAADLRGRGATVVDARLFPARLPARSPWPRGVDGYLALQTPGGDAPGSPAAPAFRHLLLAWDPAGAPDAHRRARLRAWQAAAAGATAWGAGLPPLLVLTASPAHARAWQGWLADAGPTLHPTLDPALDPASNPVLDPAPSPASRPALAVSVLVARDGGAGPGGAPGAVPGAVPGGTPGAPPGPQWWWAGTERPRVLSEWLPATATPPPAAPATAVRYDRLERGVTARRPLAPGWARAALQDPAAPLARRVAALRVRLDGLALALLQELARHPYLTVPELALVSDRPPAAVAAALRELQRGEAVAWLVAEPAAPARPVRVSDRRYTVTHVGLAVLAGRAGTPPRRYLEHTPIAVEVGPRGRGGQRLRGLRRHLDHSVGVVTGMVAIARAVRAAHLPPLTWWSEAEATVPFAVDGRGYWIRPDAAGAVTRADGIVPFLFEYDRGTMRQRDYRRKLAGLSAYYAAEVWRDRFARPPDLLVVCADAAGEARFAAAIAAAARRHGVPLPALLTRQRHLEQHPRGALGAIWRTPASEERGPWLVTPPGGHGGAAAAR